MQDTESMNWKKKSSVRRIELRSSGERAVFGLYRTAQEARLEGNRSHCSIDGIQIKRTIKKKPRSKLSFSACFFRGRQLFRQYRTFSFETKFFVMGRNGMIASVIMGVIFSGFLSYMFFGSRAAAEDASPIIVAVQQQVLGVETEEGESTFDRVAFEQNIRDMVAGYPIEDMVPYIVKQDRRVAAYLVAIAKKESNWGRRIPVYHGENCFNYWGYRGQDEIMGSAGHTCFNTPKEAVTTVAKRLNTLVLEQGLATAKELIVWKCGSSCAGHDSYGVSKWISDVDGYYREVFAMGG